MVRASFAFSLFYYKNKRDIKYFVIFHINSNLPDAMSRALGNIGLVYAQTGQFSQAIEL